MTLPAGTRLGPYEVTTPIGAGGMGEVYRARDTRLGRDVAVKVLPSHLTADPDVKARFEREAKAISQLTHPHICTLYDVGSADGVEYLVMELLEGRTLADRIDGGPLPMDQVLRYGTEIADALDRAHRAGIVHRDLKPGNVMLTKSGVKLLDFGLAKAAAGPKAVVEEMSSLPTETERPLTEKGTILGTFQYMAPEQLEGADADARTDIFALGCVLYEMATGRKAFTGRSRVSLISAILKDEPPAVSAVAAMSPPALDRLVRTCLAKDPDDRFQTAHDAGLQLRWIAEGGSQAGASAVAAPRRKSRETLAWTIAGAAILAAAALGAAFFRRPRNPAPAVVSEIGPPPEGKFALSGHDSGAPAISPDGTRLAFAAVTNGRRELWVRPLDSAKARVLPGTENATFPFWSPDGRSLGYFAAGKLQRIDVSGGPPLPLADAPAGRGGSWGRDGTILYAPALFGGIYRVPDSGGAPRAVTKPDASRQEATHRWPQFLPDGEHFLYYAHGAQQSSGTWVASLRGGEPTLLLRGDSTAVYAPPGHLLFVRQRVLMAQRFDADERRLSGEAVPVAPVDDDASVWRGVFTASGNGILVFEAGGGAAGHEYRILWYDRGGRKIGQTGEVADYDSPQLSPDGTRLAASITDPSSGVKDIWIFDLARGVKSRLTFTPMTNASPSWSPDGRTITFVSSRSGQFHLYQKASDGTGHATPILVDDAAEYRPIASPDGRYLIFNRLSSAAGAHMEIWALPLFGDRRAFPLVQNGGFDQVQASVSPDGRWLAYTSSESGREEVFVVPFLRSGGKWQVSTAGGAWPAWRADGRELYYVSPDDKLIAATIADQAGGIAVGKASELFALNSPAPPGHHYDAAADGKKFVVVDQGEQRAAAPVTLVTNWPALLRKR